MHFDPLTLMIIPALILVTAGGAAAMRLRNGPVAQPKTSERTEPPPRNDNFDDRLTGIGNRQAFEHSGASLLETALANDHEAALLVLDLDHFAAINAAHGRDGGDRLLIAFARMIHDYLPPTSLVCRLGADMFAAILPGAGSARAHVIADEIRMLFAHLAIASPLGKLQTTVSVGIAVARGAAVDVETLLQRADLCLDRAKAGGRNRVEAEGRPNETAMRQRRRGAA